LGGGTLYLDDGSADILFLHDDRFVGGAVGKLGRIVVDIFDLDHHDAATAAARRSAAAASIVRRRHVQPVRPVRLVQPADQRDDSRLRIDAERTLDQRTTCTPQRTCQYQSAVNAASEMTYTASGGALASSY